MTAQDYLYFIQTDKMLQEYGFTLYVNNEEKCFDILDKNQEVVYATIELENISVFIIGYNAGVEAI